MARQARPVDPRKNARVAFMAGAIAVGMTGLAFASVPLYRIFCQVTGLAGTTQRADAAPAAVSEKTITIRFDANVADELGWRFTPQQNVVKVKLGEQTLAHYQAQNLQSVESTGSAIFNVTPEIAGSYFNKLQCFCFTEQKLKAGETVDMPVVFFVDPAIADDPDAKNISEITLSYTFYPSAKSGSAEAAQNAAKQLSN